MSYDSFPQNSNPSSSVPSNHLFFYFLFFSILSKQSLNFFILVSLLFFDNIVHKETSRRNIDEILFEKPVKIYQIRFIRSGFPAHHNLKFVKNSTQLDSIKSFEIFYKDLSKPKSRFSLLVKTNMLNEKPQTVDTIIPIENGVHSKFFSFGLF